MFMSATTSPLGLNDGPNPKVRVGPSMKPMLMGRPVCWAIL